MSLELLAALITTAVALSLIKGVGTLHERLFPRLYESVEFPEDFFPAEDPVAFARLVEAGYERMKEIRVVICAVSRDDAPTLPLTIERIERTGARFKEYQVVVFENDSMDDTLKLLESWAARNRRVKVLSRSLTETPEFRGHFEFRLAYCRNHYLEWTIHSGECPAWEFAIVLDTDLRGGWSLDGIAATFGRSDWDAVASTSIGYYLLRRTFYDTYALRPRSVLKSSLWYSLVGSATQLRRGQPMIPVEAAFGGLGIYRRRVFETRRYDGLLRGALVCEHVPLTADSDLRCFLSPSQITVPGTQQLVERRGGGAHWKRKLRNALLNW
jgi:hypothetical protein